MDAEGRPPDGFEVRGAHRDPSAPIRRLILTQVKTKPGPVRYPSPGLQVFLFETGEWI